VHWKGPMDRFLQEEREGPDSGTTRVTHQTCHSRRRTYAKHQGHWNEQKHGIPVPVARPAP
jgi:hypothetical protein